MGFAPPLNGESFPSENKKDELLHATKIFFLCQIKSVTHRSISAF